MFGNLKKARFNLREISGAFGDLGTFLPLVLSLSILNKISLTNTFFFSGIFNIFCAFLYSIPISLQPMKAIAIETITKNESSEVLFLSGLITSFIVLLFYFTGILKIITKNISTAVISSLKIVLGLKLIELSTSLIFKGEINGKILLLLFFAFSLVFLDLKFKIPSAFLIFIFGLFFIKDLNFLSFKLNVSIPFLNLNEIYSSLKMSAIQIPLTILNSVVLTIAISKEIFKNENVNEKKISFSLFSMNILAPFFSYAPFCHGASGIVAQNKFGAKTNGSLIILGLFKIFLVFLFGGTLSLIATNFPLQILSPLLLLTSFEFLKNIKIERNTEKIIFFPTSFAMYFTNLFYGFLFGIFLEKIIKGYERKSI